MRRKFPLDSVESYVAASEAAEKKLADLFNVEQTAVPAADMPVILTKLTPKSPETLKEDIEAIRDTMKCYEGKIVIAKAEAEAYTSAKDGHPGLLRTIFVDKPRATRMFNAVAACQKKWQSSTEKLIEIAQRAATSDPFPIFSKVTI